ncbi:MAG: DnaJ C-terminal domain-containing protein [Parvularculaceae bacterium]
MARNPYKTLGVAPSAPDADIRAAFRRLAKKHHPDRNPGDATAEDKFKELSAAFEIVGDPDRRKRFDRGEIDAEGRERGGFSYRDWGAAGARRDSYAGRGGFDGFRTGGRPGGQSGGPSGGQSGGMGGDGFPHGGYGPDDSGEFADLSDIFADLFGARPREGRQQGFQTNGAKRRAGEARGRDLRYRIEVAFLDAARGGKKRVTMPDGRELELNLPAGLEDGQTLRLRGQGEPGPGGAEAGDVYVEASVTPHPHFERDGLDVHVEAPISLTEAVLGGRITVPTIEGDVSMTVPKGSSSGATLRLKGRGVKNAKGDIGDQYVKVRIVLPEGGDPDLEAFVKQWKAGAAQEPRRRFESA